MTDSLDFLMAPILEKYRLLSSDDSSNSRRNSSGEEGTGHAYLERQEEEENKSRFSRRLTLVAVGVLFGASIFSNILMALALTKTPKIHEHTPILPKTKHGEFWFWFLLELYLLSVFLIEP